jgi:hypothetical protein
MLIAATNTISFSSHTYQLKYLEEKTGTGTCASVKKKEIVVVKDDMRISLSP